MNIKYYFLACCIGICATSRAQQKYQIEASLTGIKSPKKAFLSFRDGDRKVFDSVMVREGKFRFSGKVGSPTKAYLYLRTADPLEVKQMKFGDVYEETDQAELMLEPGKVTIKGELLHSATISGGRSQLDPEAYNLAIKLVSDSVFNIWKSQQGTLPEDSAAAFKRLTYAMNLKTRQAVKEFVITHNQSNVALDIVSQNSIAISHPDEFEKMVSALAPAFKTDTNWKIAFSRMQTAKKFAVGQPALDFSQTDDNGKVISLSDVKGKYVLIDFWASWCGPCRIEYPFLKKAYSRFKDKNFEIIGISLDDKKDLWKQAIESNGFEWIQLSDLKGRQNAIAKAYGIAAIPQSFLLDPEGKIVAKNLRGDDLLETLDKLINKNQPVY